MLFADKPVELMRQTNLGETYQDLEQQYRCALSSYVDALGLDWEVSQSQYGGMTWCQAAWKAKELPPQGWKIHVSASAAEAVRLCHDVVSWLLTQRVAFKVAADIRSILRINSGMAGEMQTGKILTVYPCDDQEAARLAVELDRRWIARDGPAVPSDLAVRAQGRIFLRYGAFSGEVLINRFGEMLPALRTKDGTVVEDLRSLDGRQPDWAIPPLTGLLPAVPELLGPFEVDGESYLPLLLLHASPRGKVFLGLRLSDASEVAIKVGRRGVGGGLGGSSSEERLCSEFNVLQALAGERDAAPQPIAYVNGPDFAVLVAEYIDGQAFSELDFDQQVHCLHRLALAVSRLHAAGIVHRDIKWANTVVKGTNVRLVDFELAAPVGLASLIPGGTHGYLPPESEYHADGSVDVYALGACVAHVFLGLDPSGLALGGGRFVGLLQLAGYGRVAHIVRKLVDPRPEKRPTAAAAAEMLKDLGPSSAGARSSRIDSNPFRRAEKPAWCLRAAREAALATRGFQQDMLPGLAWKSRLYEALPPAEGMNLGAAGVALGLTSIDRACGSSQFSPDIQAGSEWLASRAPSAVAHGFFTGNAAVAVTLAVVGRRFGRAEWITAARTRLDAAVAVKEDCDLFSGAAGALYAACLLAGILDDDDLCAIAAPCAATLIRLADVRDGLCSWPSAQPEDPSLTGAAHGSAGIALALATYGHMARRADAVDLALETFQRLFRNGRVNGGTMLRRNLDNATECAPILSWCHGIAGYLWCMLLAFGDDRRLAPAIDWCLEKCVQTQALGSPVYCHGVAGELELWRLISAYPRLAASAAHRADRAASVLRLQLRREAGLCVWGSDDPEVLTPDLWVGFMGPATALALYAREVRDPLLSVAWLSHCAVPIA